MPVTFKLTASIPVELDNPSDIARSLVRALTTRNQSLDDLMSTFISFFPELARSFYASEPYDTRKLLLAVAVLRKFYNPMALRPIYNPILIEHMALVIPIVVPLMIDALEQSFDEAERHGHDHPSDSIVVLSTLTALLTHETGIAEFAHSQSSMLTGQIRSIIKMWIKVSGSATKNIMDIDLVKIIQALTKYTPTRVPLEVVLEDTPRPHFLNGLSCLHDTVSALEDPAFVDLPNSLATNMRGLGALCIARPSLRKYLFRHGAHTALCKLLGYSVIDRPRKIAEQAWPAEKYTTYDHILCISEELHLLLKDEVDSPMALLCALEARLLQSIFHAVAYFGGYMLTPCGAMPFLIRYISDWCAKSRRVASNVLSHVNAFRTLDDIWNAMPQMPTQNAVTVSWHAFMHRVDTTVQASQVTRKVIIPCLNRACINAALESRRKRCERCKTFTVCSSMCFRAAHRAGFHECQTEL